MTLVEDKTRFEILLATRNPGKIREIQEALVGAGVWLRYLDEFADITPVVEAGRSYQENAILKASGYSKQTGLTALADDSGLEVDALGGRPGLFSARFAGNHATDAARIQQLLAALSEHPWEKRTARFICCMALVGGRLPGDTVQPSCLHLTEGRCEGVIADEARGTNGFGFDPVFVPCSSKATFAELPAQVKSMISHRALALHGMRSFLERWVAQT